MLLPSSNDRSVARLAQNVGTIRGLIRTRPRTIPPKVAIVVDYPEAIPKYSRFIKGGTIPVPNDRDIGCLA